MPQYIFLGTFLCCTFFLQWMQQPLYPFWIWLLLLECILFFWKKSLAFAGLGTLLALTVVARSTHIPSTNTVDWYATKQDVVLKGVIVDEPDKRPLQTKYTITVHSIRNGSGVHMDGITGNVLVSDHRQWPELHYGDDVTAKGILERPEKIDNFAYNHYLSRYNIYAVMYRSAIQRNSTPPTFSFKRILYAVKSRFEQQINTLYPEPHASFMAGLLTGSRKGIPSDLMEDFNETGLTHIIAISGYNITIVITLIMGMLFWLPQRVRYLCAIASIIVFTIFVGASAAVVRAAIMGILGLLALHGGHTVSARLCVLWAACFMVGWNPKILWYDAGFQLSFLAVIGLIELSPLLERLCARFPEKLGIRESITMTIAAQLSAVPLIVLLFGRLSFIAPITNMIVAPAIPLAMLFGAIGTIVSFLSAPLGLVLSYAGWATLQWIVWVAHIGAALPFSSVSLSVTLPIIITYYAVLLMTIYIVRSSSSPESKAPLLFLKEYAQQEGTRMK